MGGFNSGGFSPSNTVVTDLEVDEGTISVDTSNNFVGIGTTTPRSDLTIEGTITVKERAAAKGDTAAYGQLWVKSDAPTSLYFTTDAGSDIQITSGTSLAGVAGSLSGLGSTDNVILRSSGTGGETAQGSGIAIDDSNNASGMGTLACGAITTSGVFDVTNTTDSSNATGDTGALRTEGGASIAKKLYVGTDLDVNGTANLDNTDVDGTLAVDGTTISLDATTSLNIDNSNTTNGITVGTATSGVPISIGHATSETTVNDNLSVTGDLAVDGTANLDNTDIDGTFTMDGTAFDVNSTTTCAIDNTNTSNGVTINTVTSGGPISIGHATSETTVNDNLTVTGNLAINGASTTLTSTAASEPVLHITNTHAGATSGELRFNKDSASGDDSDIMGLISFYGTDAGEATHERLAYVDAIITDSAAGSEAASLRFYVAENDAALTQGLLIAGQADDDGEVDVTIGAGAASTTTIAGTLTMGSTAALTNAGLVAVANQSNITGVGALASGTIAAGFGAIDNGTSGIRTNTFTAETSVVPSAQDGAALGTSSLQWSDLFLADEAVISFGDNNEITLTHVHDDGLILKHVGTGDGKEPSFSFHCGDDDIAADDVLGSLFWKAPDEGAGTDAILVAAGIEAVSEGDFAADNNATKLSFLTGASEAAAEKMSLSSGGNLAISGDLTVSGNDITFGNGATIVNDSSSLLTITEAEILLPTTSKLSFHDTGGGENIVASSDGHLEVNAGTILDMSAPTLDLNATTKIQLDTPTVQLFSGTTNKPLLSLECTNPDALGGTFQFVKNGASVADNDVIGTIKFISEDDGSAVHTYSTIVSTIDDMTAGEESGKLTFSVASHDGGIEQGLLLAGGSVDAEVDVTLGNGTASVTAVVGNLTVGDDLSLTTDSAVLNMGAGNDVTFTHDGTTGLTIAATPISIDSTGELHLNSTTGDIKLQVGGTDQIAFDLDGTGGQVIMKAAVDADDIVFSQYDGTECARIRDGAGNMPTNLQGLASGLGHRRPVAIAAAPDANVAISLTAAESGQLILCDAGANSLTFTLPAVATDAAAGITYTFVQVADVAGGQSVIIKTAGAGTDNFDSIMLWKYTSGANPAFTAGGDTLTIVTGTNRGSILEITCIGGGADGDPDESWLAQSWASDAATSAHT